ncbi:MAG: hypothetical protein QNJ45_12280 [Ardenticatenaceae bacterium]|nr:hypothetical protein [Ardenticatenaceae bacterium]
MFRFRRTRFLPFIVFGLFVLLILGSFRSMTARSSYMRGFYDGQASVQQAPPPVAEGDGEAAAPAQSAPQPYAHDRGHFGHGYYHGHRGPGVFGFLLFLFFGLLFFKFIGRMIWGRRGRWHHGYGPHDHGPGGRGPDSRSRKERYFDENPDETVMEM